MTWTFLKLFCPKWDLRQILHGISDSSQKTLQKNQIINIHIPYSQPIQYNFLKGKKTSLIKKKEEEENRWERSYVTWLCNSGRGSHLI